MFGCLAKALLGSLERIPCPSGPLFDEGQLRLQAFDGQAQGKGGIPQSVGIKNCGRSLALILRVGQRPPDLIPVLAGLFEPQRSVNLLIGASNNMV
jgi:hypothetical protein